MFYRLRALLHRRRGEAELDHELQFHRDRQFAKYLASGLSESEAARLVRLEFGGLDQIKDECREARGVTLLENFLRDLRYGLRSFRRSPGFTAAALLTFALGIGANTAVFSVLYSVLLHSLPYADANRIVILHETTPKVGQVSVSYPNFKDWQAQTHSFSGMAFVANTGFDVIAGKRGEQVDGQVVSPNFRPLLGVPVLAGRGFSRQEKTPVLLVSYAFAESHFGNAYDALGRAISVDQKTFTIIGVLPPGFRWTEKSDLLLPLDPWLLTHPDYEDRGNRNDTVTIARLAPGVSLATAALELKALAARLAKEYPDDNGQFGAIATPIRDALTGDLRPAVLVLFVAAIFVFLIACANVGSLLIVRSLSRSTEISMRLALGASRGRIILQMLAESLLLTLGGTFVGFLIAFAIVLAIARLIPEHVLHGAQITPNGPALLFATGVALTAAFIFGFAPALRSRLELKKWRRSGNRDLLAAVEVSLALVLLVGAGLMTKSLYRLMAVDAGVRTDHILTTDPSLHLNRYQSDPAALAFWTRLIDTVGAIPGVKSAATGTGVPLTFEHSRSDIRLEGFPEPKPGTAPHPDVHIVSTSYLSTLGVQFLRGHAFTDFDDEHSTPVGLINARLARQFFANSNPIGRRFKWSGKWVTIIGIVHDTKLYGLDNPSRLEIYVPLRQQTPHWMTLVVRSSNDPRALAGEIRNAIAQLDPNQPVQQIQTLDSLLAGLAAPSLPCSLSSAPSRYRWPPSASMESFRSRSLAARASSAFASPSERSVPTSSVW